MEIWQFGLADDETRARDRKKTEKKNVFRSTVWVPVWPPPGADVFFLFSLEASSLEAFSPPRVDFRHLAFSAVASNVSRYLALKFVLAYISLAYFLIGVIYLMPSIKRGLSSSLNSSCEDLGVSDLEESSPAKRISINAHMSSFASILSPPPHFL